MSSRSELFRSPFLTSRWRGPVTDHFDGQRFWNLPRVAHGSAGDLAKWMTHRERGPWERRPRDPGPPPAVRVDELRVTFVGHATCLIQVAGVNVLTDPVWADRVSPVSFAGPRRFTAPGIRFEDLPPIDLVLLSHDHYDHLCEPTTRRLAREHAPTVVTGLGNAALLGAYGIERCHELDWWDRVEVGDATITFVPAQHFSGRGVGDRDRTLWGGLVLEVDGRRVYFAGDTGMNGPMFEQIRERCGAPDLALMPIGAFRPEWFMSRVHVSPAEAVEAARLVGARVSVPIHFGAFALADDGQDEPLRALEAALAEADDGSEWRVLTEGAAYDVAVASADQRRVSV
ncbi:MAG: MBL fold metallo-hydrolase [Sandaracinaceae bacterium]|nr:MBL fold metallo-hydrolase [Sandaracinaceae bacterium]